MNDASYDRFLDGEISRATDGERKPDVKRRTVAVIDWTRRLLAECAIMPDEVQVDRIDRFTEGATYRDQWTIPPRDWAAQGIDAFALADLRALAVETWDGLHEGGAR